MAGWAILKAMVIPPSASNADRWADLLPAERYLMDFWYHVAERLIAHIICVTPFLVWWGIASVVSWQKENAAQQYVQSDACHCGAQKVVNANHCKSCGYVSL